MLRIRFHGRGGQGMKTAGRVLGTAFFLEGWEVQDAPRYGAERRGAPMFAYVRAGRSPIRERGAVRTPDLVVVADDTLVPVPAAGVLAGVDARAVLLLHTETPPEIWKDRLHLDATILAFPRAPEAGDARRAALVGAECAGAAARLAGAIRRETLERALREEIGPLGAEALAESLERALGAYDRAAPWAGAVRERPAERAEEARAPDWIRLAAESAELSSPSIRGAATSEAAHTGLWRTMRPEIDESRCNRCWWVCSTHCPEGAIRVEEGGRPAIDYDHCKGCMICVSVCPPHAIAAAPEHRAAPEAGA